MKNIYQTIAAVMEDIGAVGKTSRNQQQGFMFRGIDAVMNAINPALIKNKCFIVPEILDQNREERQTAKGGTLIYSVCRVKYTFYAEDGSSLSAVVIGEGMDSGDKATNKAMSIAFKYACFQVFCIPTEEMRDADPDKETPEPSKPTTEQKAIASRKPMSLDEQLMLELKRTGVGIKSMCNSYGVNHPGEMLDSQKQEAIERLRGMRERMRDAGNRQPGAANGNNHAAAAQTPAREGIPA